MRPEFSDQWDMISGMFPLSLSSYLVQLAKLSLVYLKSKINSIQVLTIFYSFSSQAESRYYKINAIRID